jgi:hypothetical protein
VSPCAGTRWVVSPGAGPGRAMGSSWTALHRARGWVRSHPIQPPGFPFVARPMCPNSRSSGSGRARRSGRETTGSPMSRCVSSRARRSVSPKPADVRAVTSSYSARIRHGACRGPRRGPTWPSVALDPIVEAAGGGPRGAHARARRFSARSCVTRV